MTPCSASRISASVSAFLTGSSKLFILPLLLSVAPYVL
ncbi:hypothetical protein 2200_scaffold2278_00029 [Bacteriophage sp.]|nr:hypothetical protein 2200_scaffold2278_00029 [Bacteriophage sp.]